MKAFLFIALASATGLSSSLALADYYSARDQINQQRQALANAEWQLGLAKGQALYARRIQTFATLHGGFTAGPSISTESNGFQHGEFSTADGYECATSMQSLKCANVRTGDTFEYFIGFFRSSDDMWNHILHRSAGKSARSSR